MCSALRTRERVAAVGRARLHVAELDHHRRGHRHPRVPLALGPDREREAAARAQHAADLAQRRRRVALEHVAEPGEDAVDARRRRARAARSRARGTRRSRARAPRRRGARPRPCSASGRSRSGGRSRPRRAAARKPVSPVPAASSRIVCPGRGSSRSTSHSRDLAGRLLEQVAAPVPARRHLLPQLVVGAPPRREATARQRGELVGATAPTRRRPRSRAPARAWSRPRSPRRPSAGRRGRRSRRRAAAAPRSRANASSASIRSQVASSTSRPCSARREPSGAGSPAPVLPGEQAAREREVRQQPEPEPLAGRDQVALGVAREPRVLVLRRDEPRLAPRRRRPRPPPRPARPRGSSGRGSAPCPRARARPSRRASPRSA